MKLVTSIFLTLLAVFPLSMEGARRPDEPTYVLKRLHAGPDAPVESADPDEGYVYVEDPTGRSCPDGEDCCGHWTRVRRNRCRDSWRCYDQRTPLYDYDIEGDSYDSTFDWPGRKTDSWMYEVSH